MDDNEFGTAEERAAVRAALLALKDFNRKLIDCRSLRIECRLERDGLSYLADFEKRTPILPSGADDALPKC